MHDGKFVVQRNPEDQVAYVRHALAARVGNGHNIDDDGGVVLANGELLRGIAWLQ